MPKCTFIFVCIYTVLYCFHWEHQHVEGVQSAHGGSLRCEGIGQIQNWCVILKEDNLGFHLNMNCRPFLKTSQIMPKCTFIFVCIYTVLYCFHWEHQHVEGVQSAHGGSLRCEGIGQIQNWYVILKEENLGFHLYINLLAILKNLSNYAQVYIHICLYLHCIVLFPLRAPASWWSAKCTRRLFKVRRNWPNSKLICYSERGEPMLSFEYELSATLENSLRCERICKKKTVGHS